MSTLVDQILGIIAEEVGESTEDLGPDVEFADLGIDKLLEESILIRSRKVTGVDLPSNLFESCPTVESLKIFLTTLKPQPSLGPQSPAGGDVSTGTNTAQPPQPQQVADAVLPSQPLSIRLQGSPKTAKKIIFLLPDGSGSAMSYARLPPLGPGICVYGLNSPFLSNPQDFVPIPDIAPIWASEIRQLQPVGPYTLGGWSAGGYYCFEVAKYLMHHVTEHDGEPVQVEKLILIDSPCRAVFEALPMVVVRTLSSQGLMGNWGTNQAPKWLLDHFDATIVRVEEYIPEPLTLASNRQTLPEVFVIWAINGVYPPGGAAASGLDLNTKVTKFMLEDREDFGPNGWDTLFPNGTKMAFTTTPGTHFTLIFPPHVSNMHVYLSM